MDKSLKAGTGKNTIFQFLDILENSKNTYKVPKFGKVRQVPKPELVGNSLVWTCLHDGRTHYLLQNTKALTRISE